MESLSSPCKNFLVSHFLTLEAQIPSRWVLGEARIVQLLVDNRSGMELSHLRLRACWPETGGAQEAWRDYPPLRPHQDPLLLEYRLSPAHVGEDVLQFQIQARIGEVLDVELHSAKSAINVRTRPVEGNININVSNRNEGKSGMGGIVTDGSSGFGNQTVNLHGASPTLSFEEWLATDQRLQQMPPLPLTLATEACLPWQNHQGMDLCGIPAGSFVMGASPDDPEAQPDEARRRVHLTISEYQRITGNPSPVTLPSHMSPRMAVANLTWEQALTVCQQLTAKESDAGTLPAGYHYRLPTEAEWEYVCRAGTTTPHYGPLREVGSVSQNGRLMKDVASYPANAWGLHDMLGLVFEWCLDAYAPALPSQLSNPYRPDPIPGTPLQRIVRGGCYQGPDRYARASARASRPPDGKSHRIGIRLVLAKRF